MLDDCASPFCDQRNRSALSDCPQAPCRGAGNPSSVAPACVAAEPLGHPLAPQHYSPLPARVRAADWCVTEDAWLTRPGPTQPIVFELYCLDPARCDVQVAICCTGATARSLPARAFLCAACIRAYEPPRVSSCAIQRLLRAAALESSTTHRLSLNVRNSRTSHGAAWSCPGRLATYWALAPASAMQVTTCTHAFCCIFPLLYMHVLTTVDECLFALAVGVGGVISEREDGSAAESKVRRLQPVACLSRARFCH